MKIKAILFDLDGTLLPMDQDIFIKAYLSGLVKVLAPKGYQPEAVATALWTSTGAMFKNDGKKRNEEVFWESFSAILGDSVRDEEENLRVFYNTDFQKIGGLMGYSAVSKEIIELLKSKGITVVLATNPLFPAVATESRIRWAGLSPEDFALYTTYENSRFCKPNLNYYTEIFEKMSLDPEECLMVGNDVGEDMIASKLGADCYLVTDCLINKSGEDINNYKHGDLSALYDYLKEITNE